VKVQWAMRVTDEERASEQPPQCRKTRDGIDKGETTFLSGSTYSVARATPVRAPRVILYTNDNGLGRRDFFLLANFY